MAEVTPISVSLSPLDRRSVEGRFDVAAMSSDAGVLWLAEVERKLGIADALASCVRDCRDPGRILHSVADMMRFRMLAIAAGWRGLYRRFIVTSLKGKPKRLYEKLYCARGQAENLIFAHKVLLASDRTSCSSPTANQFRIILHTAAFMLLHHLRAAMPKRSIWRNKRFDTIRLGLIKIAALIEEKRTRIIVRMPQACSARFSLAAAAMTIITAPP